MTQISSNFILEFSTPYGFSTRTITEGVTRPGGKKSNSAMRILIFDDVH